MAKKSATRRILTIIGGLLLLAIAVAVVGRLTGLFGGGDDAVAV